MHKSRMIALIEKCCPGPPVDGQNMISPTSAAELDDDLGLLSKALRRLLVLPPPDDDQNPIYLGASSTVSGFESIRATALCQYWV